MKIISVSVDERDYEEFQRAGRRDRRPVAELIREAMALYRAERLAPRRRLEDLPVFSRPRPRGPLPPRVVIQDEIALRSGRRR